MVFYRIEPTPDGQSYSHHNLMALLTALGTRTVGTPSPSRLPFHPVSPTSDRTRSSQSLKQVDLFDLDPHKGRFGLAKDYDGLTLRVANIRKRKDKVVFDLERGAPSVLSESVHFHYHPTSEPQSELVKPSPEGEARTTLRAVGGFTVGAVAGKTRLDLDLAEDIRFP